MSAAARRARLAGRAGLAATAASVVLTLAVAAAGPSVMEPALPGGRGQPPWALGLRLSPYLAVAATAAALAAGTLGLGLCLAAVHRGWHVPARRVLTAGIAAATALALVPPFGSSDQLSYAAYGRMAATGYDPYTTTPAMLARLGDPVARAVQDWRASPSVYGSLATAGEALASWAGGTSVRLTVFVLSLLNVAAFAGTALLLHRLTRRSEAQQLRAALVWAGNPLLLQVLVAGGHVDSQAVIFAVAAVAIFVTGMRAPAGASWARTFATGAAAGAVAGLGSAVKLTVVLVPAGLAAAAVLSCWPPGAGRPDVGLGGADPGRAGPGTGAGRPDPAPAGPGRVRHRFTAGAAVGGLALGFALTVAVSLIPWGLVALRPALHAGSYVSIGSPWRPVRSALTHWLAFAEPTAEDAVRAGAIVLMLVLVLAFLRPLRDLAGRPAATVVNGPAGSAAPVRPARPAGVRPTGAAGLAAAGAFVFAFSWLMAWPYVLPWYDSLAWALLALLPVSQAGAAGSLPGARPRRGAARAVLTAPRRAGLAGPPWAAAEWLLLARTAALAFGYLPARGIAMPAGLGWLQSVVRTGVTPAVLLVVTVALVMLLWPPVLPWSSRVSRPSWVRRGPSTGGRLAG